MIGLSSSELLLLIREKLSRVVLCSTVSARIESLKAEKRARGNSDPDTEYRVVFHGDLDHAISEGNLVDHCQTSYAPDWWSCTVRGVDRSGEELIVMVEVSRNPSDPLVITDFSLGQ